MAEELAGPSIYSYNLTTETMLNLDEAIYILSPKDLPLMLGIGADGTTTLPRLPVDQTVFYWMEEDVPLPRGILNEDLDNSETDVTMATGDAVRFAVGDGIRIDDEIMVVTAIDTSTEVLTVIRGSAATTNTTVATHSTGAEVIGLGTILIEGALGVANFQGRDRYSNYCQIWSKTIQMSRTEQRIRKYGVPNELVKQTLNAIQELWLGVEHSAMYGVPHVVTATNRRQTGGLDHFVTSNENTGDEWITVDSIEAMQALAWDLGGGFETIIGRPGAFRALNNIAGVDRVQTVDVSDRRRGRQRAMVVSTEYGDVNLARSRWVKKTEAFAITPQNFIFRVFQPLVQFRLAKTDDTDKFGMVMEGGFEVKGQDHMGKWTGLNTAAALPGSGLV